jgi:hypothetical protein
MEAIHEVIEHTLMITAFVAVMMITVEYVNVLTQGSLVRVLRGAPWLQLVVAALLGALPGCLGSFLVVTLYTHRIVSLGALVACMIATSGDEAFVMLALFPGKAVALIGGLAVLGVIAGALTDLVAGAPRAAEDDSHPLALHEGEASCCFPRGEILSQLRHLSMARGVLAVGIGLFGLAVALGEVGPHEWNWVRVTLLVVAAFGLFVVLTVSEHFLEEHLWEHSVKQHLPRLLLWTLGALTLIAVLHHFVQAEQVVRDSRWLALVFAGLIGVIPESGPHLFFVTMHHAGTVPLSTLIVSSIVQDGHGALPLLADSRRAFFKVKAINLMVGLGVGALLMALGH